MNAGARKLINRRPGASVYSKRFIYINLLVLWLYMCLPAKMLYAVPSDRIPKYESLEKFRKDPAFNYEEAPRGPTLWDRFMQWLREFLSVERDSYADTFLSRDLWYILFAGVLIALIYTIFKSEIRGVFYNSPKTNTHMKLLEEDINALNFDELIAEAVKQQNYRYAIRLNYLKNLKELHDKNLIDWKPYKTNQDYVRELSGNALYASFSGITKLFNWIWYGDLAPTQEEYGRLQKEFLQFSRQLNLKA